MITPIVVIIKIDNYTIVFVIIYNEELIVQFVT